MTEYQPITAVWEITMACNMRCMHCGSACENALPEELTTDEALKLCDDLGKLGMKWITLSGGEPLTRKDWPQIAKQLRKNNIIPNIITNGWFLDVETVKKMRESNIGTVAISLDGIKETHDKIRCKGSFDRNMNAFDRLNKHGQYNAAITSINKTNIDQLDDIYKILLEKDVKSWQLQICIPMGNMKQHQDKLVSGTDIDLILDFCLKVARENKVIVYPADCLGYYTEKEETIRSICLGTTTSTPWQGCNAGKRGFGILHNGDILGCTSIRDREFIEGNIREKNIVEIWNDEKAFSWIRDMTRNDLDGECKSCVYGDTCLGGCPNTRLTMNGKLKSESPYCSFKNAISKLKEKVAVRTDFDNLMLTAKEKAQAGNLQESAIILEHILANEPDNEDALALTGYVHFFIGDYDMAKTANEQILKSNPDHSYANKGLGLTLHKMGETEKGISFIEKAIELAPEGFMDPYYDLAAVYNEIGQTQKANEVLSKIPAYTP